MIKETVLVGWLLCAPFVAATLQGSRLPEQPAGGEKVAGRGDTGAYYPGTGSDKDDYPPLRDTNNVLA